MLSNPEVRSAGVLAQNSMVMVVAKPMRFFKATL